MIYEQSITLSTRSIKLCIFTYQSDKGSVVYDESCDSIVCTCISHSHVICECPNPVRFVYLVVVTELYQIFLVMLVEFNFICIQQIISYIKCVFKCRTNSLAPCQRQSVRSSRVRYQTAPCQNNCTSCFFIYFSTFNTGSCCS